MVASVEAFTILRRRALNRRDEQKHDRSLKLLKQRIAAYFDEAARRTCVNQTGRLGFPTSADLLFNSVRRTIRF